MGLRKNSKLIEFPAKLEMWLLEKGYKIINCKKCYNCKNLEKCRMNDYICKRILIKNVKTR